MKPLIYACLVLCVALFVACSRNAEPPAGATPQQPAAPVEPATGQAQPAEPAEPAPVVQPATAAPVAEPPAAPAPAADQPADQGMAYIPPFYNHPAEAGVLLPVLDPVTVPAFAQLAYAAAQENPELMAQLPCFCYCDRFGHRSLHDCFSGRHAIDCDICQREAIEGLQMAKEGMSVQAIREAIIKKHRPPL